MKKRVAQIPNLIQLSVPAHGAHAKSERAILGANCFGCKEALKICNRETIEINGEFLGTIDGALKPYFASADVITLAIKQAQPDAAGLQKVLKDKSSDVSLYLSISIFLSRFAFFMANSCL